MELRCSQSKRSLLFTALRLSRRDRNLFKRINCGINHVNVSGMKRDEASNARKGSTAESLLNFILYGIWIFLGRQLRVAIRRYYCGHLSIRSILMMDSETFA